jgi:plasmid stabilization system protein ParE
MCEFGASYSVFFIPEASRIVVLAVFHVRRDPLKWQSRI